MKILVFLMAMIGSLLGLEIQTIKADFLQEISGEQSPIKYSGILMARADSKAYWRYDTPFKKEIFVNKNRALIYESEFNQLIISDKLELDFLSIINSVQKNGNNWESNVNNQTFTIIFEGKTPHKILYKDELDNDIIITLKNVKLNEKIDSEIFKFKIPDNTDIIYQ